MVFQRPGKRVYFFTLTHPETGQRATFSCRTKDREVAKDVEGTARKYLGRRRWDVAGLLFSKRLDPGTLYDHDVVGDVDAFVADLLAKAASPDLTPYRTEWARTHAEYDRQLGTLYPKDLTLGLFTRKEVLRRLKALKVQSPTRNRYKAAASSFAAHLVDEEVLEHNFVRTIKGFGEHTARVVYYSMADAKTLIAGLAQPYAGIAAFALGFAAEWCAIRDLKVADLQLDADPVTATVRGAKREWRHRMVPLIPELAWTLDYLKPALKGKIGPAFPKAKEWDALRTQQAAAKALKLVAIGEDRFTPHTLHDWRHTHAVIVLRSGYGEQIAASHLGHKNTDLIRKTYGVYMPDRFDYAKQPRPDHQRPRRENTSGGEA